jgi:hypothetical protein
MLLVLFGSSFSMAQPKRNASSNIDSIFTNPGKYADETIVVEGTIIQYVAEPTRTTAFYLIKSDYGSVIKVITSSATPEINQRYRVGGIVSISQSGPIIKEDSKTCLTCLIPTPPKGLIEILKENILLVIIVALVILALIIGIIYLVVIRTKATYPVEDYIPEHVDSSSKKGESTKMEPSAVQEIRYDESYQTVRIPKITESTNTLKFIPVGKLMIESGPDSGRMLALSGYQTSEGVVLSLGRDIEGWKDYLLIQKQFNPNRLLAHILIKDPSSTLSRLQAELIYKNNKMYIRHHGSNPTVIEGVEMAVGELKEISYGSIIQAGAMVFKYIQ